MEPLFLLTILVSSIVVTLVFTVGFKNNGPWNRAWLYSIIVFMATWAQAGFAVSGSAFDLMQRGYIVFILAFINALLLASTKKPVLQQNRARTIHGRTPVTLRPDQQESKKITTYNIYYWMLLFALSVIIAIQYFIPT